MKLIQEYLIKIIILVISLSILMEIILFILFYLNSIQIFNTTYKQTMLNTEEKSIEITQKIAIHIKNVIVKYLADLKLIGKHALLLNGKGKNFTTEMNKNAKIVNNNNKQKHIVKATREELLKVETLKKVYNQFFEHFEYFLNYEAEFEKINEHNQILNSFFSDSHQELNYVGFYSPSKISSENELEIKFMVSIFKTILIRRYIGKRTFMDYIRFLIINQVEIYIYPPEAYNNTNIYYFENSYPTGKCNFSSTNSSKQFPLCVYNYFTNVIVLPHLTNLIIIKEKIILEKNFAALCLKIPFLRNQTNFSFVCSELEFSSIFSNAEFEIPQKFEFGMFTFSDNEIAPLFYCKKDMYEKIITTFNNTNQTHQLKTIKNSQIFSMYHFLYYNLTETLKNHSELKLDSKEIDKEYKEIENKISTEINNFNKNETKKEPIMISFNKTVCQKKLLNNDYEFIKDEFKMIIFPLTFEIHSINEDYLENKLLLANTLDLYIYSIIPTNPKINKQKLMTMINIKIERVVLLFVASSL